MVIIIIGYFLYYNYSHLLLFFIIIKLFRVKLSKTVNAHIDAWLSEEHHILVAYISNFNWHRVYSYPSFQ